MDQRVKYMEDLLDDCAEVVDDTDDKALEIPIARAIVIGALVIADAINGLRKTMKRGA